MELVVFMLYMEQVVSLPFTPTSKVHHHPAVQFRDNINLHLVHVIKLGRMSTVVRILKKRGAKSAQFAPYANSAHREGIQQTCFSNGIWTAQTPRHKTPPITQNQAPGRLAGVRWVT